MHLLPSVDGSPVCRVGGQAFHCLFTLRLLGLAGYVQATLHDRFVDSNVIKPSSNADFA